MYLEPIIYAILLLPLTAAIAVGLGGKIMGRTASHRICITAVALTFIFSCYVFKLIVLDHVAAVNISCYAWGKIDIYRFNVGFLVDNLSAVMALVVSFISLVVHVYSVGYMKDDSGYQRFFAYVSLFTFAMLTLVLSNNLLLMFFGWEGVGLMSYLLIGFWFEREDAARGSLKAFIVNRVGDIGFILALGAVLAYFNTFDFQAIFRTLQIGVPQAVVTTIALLLFVGAMAKSAQMPLHVWLPESMAGPTPISALIHAATMVTAGIYMVSRMSPLFEHSEFALTVVLTVGATTALFTGLLAIVEYDIKRVIAYSTLSQLGYMVVALGVSAYSVAMFHLLTHAFFKALLFLAAGSVIIALHHEQDMRKMGGLWRKMPVTYVCSLIGSLALVALPPFAGFYSKDAIIDAVANSHITGAKYAYFCVLAGVFITALYTFRALFLTFHGESHVEKASTVKESSLVILLPLIALAMPSVLAGLALIHLVLLGTKGIFGSSLLVSPSHNVMQILLAEYHGAWHMAWHALYSLPLWLSVLGILCAWIVIIKKPAWAAILKSRLSWLHLLLINKYGFDALYLSFAKVLRTISLALYYVCDLFCIDTIAVSGSGFVMRTTGRIIRLLQTGFIYHYIFIMAAGILILFAWVLF